MRRITTFILFIALIGSTYWYKETLLTHFLSRRLGSELSIQEIQFGLKELTFKGVSIKNPSPSILPYAFDGATVKVRLNMLDLWKKDLPIEQLRIENATLLIELQDSTGAKNNWATLLHEFSKRRDGKEYSIDKLIVTNLRFQGVRDYHKELSIPPLRHFELENLGHIHSLTLGSLSHTIFQSLLLPLTSKPHLAKLLDHVSTKPLPPPLKSTPSSKKDSTPREKAICQGIEMYRRTQNLFS
ncbi:MAG: hypothetical protein S4CHLAM45_02230 [Chlamydiales bacterium]|nr:hypothetical protein [Chlamydiales bacterium]MCH9622345.1 hypothetical protein [Chlamydiales bacterium]